MFTYLDILEELAGKNTEEFEDKIIHDLLSSLSIEDTDDDIEGN